MVYIVLSVLGLLATLAIQTKWNWRTQVIFIVLTVTLGLIFFLGIVFILEYMEIIEKSGTSFLSQIPWREIGLYFCMLAGMAAKYFYDWIGSGTGKQRQFKKWQLFKPMFVSPLVFGTVYASMGEITSVVLLLIFAFQNGFFWQTVMNKPPQQLK